MSCRYVLRFCISGMICTRVVVFRWIGLWNYFYKRRKQKDVVVQQSKADRLPFASQRTHTTYTPITLNIYMSYAHIRREAFNYWPLTAPVRVRVTAVIRFIVACCSVQHLAIDRQNIEWRSSRVGGRNTDRIFP
jgi:hypothetical protein